MFIEEILPTITNSPTYAAGATKLANIKNKADNVLSDFINTKATSLTDAIAKVADVFQQQDVLFETVFGRFIDIIDRLEVQDKPRIIEYEQPNLYHPRLSDFRHQGHFIEISQDDYDYLISIFTNLDSPITFTLPVASTTNFIYNFNNEVETITTFYDDEGYPYSITGICSTYKAAINDEDVKLPFIWTRNDTGRCYITYYPFSAEDARDWYRPDTQTYEVFCVSLPFMINGLKQSWNLASVFNTICKRVSETGAFVYNDIVTELTTLHGSISSTVSTILDTMHTAWNKYGLVGVVKRISELLDTFKSASASGSSVTLPTVTSIYIARSFGLIFKAIGSLVYDVAAAIVSLYFKGVGIALLLVKNMFSTIKGALTQAVDKSVYASIDTAAQQWLFPVPLLLEDMNISSFDSDFRTLLRDKGYVKIDSVGVSIIYNYYINAYQQEFVYVYMLVQPVITNFPTNLYNYIQQCADLNNHRIVVDRENFTRIQGLYELDYAACYPKFDDSLCSNLAKLESSLSTADFDKRLRQIYAWNLLYGLLYLTGRCITSDTSVSSTITFTDNSSNTNLIGHAIYSLVIGSLYGSLFEWTDFVDSNVSTSYGVRALATKPAVTDTYIEYFDDSIYQSSTYFSGILTRVLPYRDANLYNYSNWVYDYKTDTFLITLPKYDRISLITGLIAAGLAVAVTVGVTAVLSVKAKQFQRSWNAKHTARVENAWEEFKSEPTTSNYNAYKKSVLKSNLLTKLTGGTKFSYNSYWDTPDTNEGFSGTNLWDLISGNIGNSAIAPSDTNVNNLKKLSDAVANIDPSHEIEVDLQEVLDSLDVVSGKVDDTNANVISVKSLIKSE